MVVITIDTQKDSSQDIKKIISYLQTLISEEPSFSQQTSSVQPESDDSSQEDFFNVMQY